MSTKFVGAWEFLPTRHDLPHLRRAAAGCEGCELFVDTTQTVFGDGPADAALMLVGEQPGDVEDREGQPFVGPAGRVLTAALDEAGLADVPTYVTNAVKHFSFRRAGNRRLHQTPRAGHVNACRPWLRAEYEALHPSVVVVLGATAVKAIFGNEVKVTRDRGAILERAGLIGEGTFVVTVHPSSILRAPEDTRREARAAFVADLKVAANALRAGDGR